MRNLELWRLWYLLAVMLTAAPSFGQALTSTRRGVVVAHDGVVELRGAWRVNGVQNATSIAAKDDRVVVLDAMNNEAVIVGLANGKATRMATAETPVAAVFAGSELYILARDAGLLQRVGGADQPVNGDLLRESDGRVYVYSRVRGVLQKIDGRRYAAPPFASDLEVSGNTAWLAYPREGRIRTIDLTTGDLAEIAVGAVPVDLALAGGGTALSARIVAVADPSAKRVWLTESTQSTAAAIARGFLRGFLGLGLFGGKASQFPTGVDRVETRGKYWVAYDSSSGTLYQFTRQQSTVLARGIGPRAWTLTPAGVAWWNGTSVAETPSR